MDSDRLSKPDAMQLAFQTVIDELYFWINKDHAHKLSGDMITRHNIDDAWTEIALRLERWQQNERTEATGSDGD